MDGWCMVGTIIYTFWLEPSVSLTHVDCNQQGTIWYTESVGKYHIKANFKETSLFWFFTNQIYCTLIILSPAPVLIGFVAVSNVQVVFRTGHCYEFSLLLFFYSLFSPYCFEHAVTRNHAKVIFVVILVCSPLKLCVNCSRQEKCVPSCVLVRESRTPMSEQVLMVTFRIVENLQKNRYNEMLL